jgi:MFS superfamily sulfate permease-like transporter
MGTIGSVIYYVCVGLAAFMLLMAAVTIGAYVADISEAKVGHVVTAVMMAGVFYMLARLFWRMTR